MRGACTQLVELRAQAGWKTDCERNQQRVHPGVGCCDWEADPWKGAHRIFTKFIRCLRRQAERDENDDEDRSIQEERRRAEEVGLSFQSGQSNAYDTNRSGEADTGLKTALEV